MRAMECAELGGPDRLRLVDRKAAEPGPGQVAIAVRAAGVNFPDALIVAGKYQRKPPLPFVPGHEVAGTVAALGPGVEGLAPGQRVVGLCGTGGFAERVVQRADLVTPMPDGLPFEEAAAFPVVYATSHYALKTRAALRAGETLLVLGAAGGVGLTAVEIGAALGATVIAAASSAEKLALAAEHGAAHLVDYRADSLRERVKALTGGAGADVIYDPVGGDAFDDALRCVGWGGRILVIGFASGRIPSAPANLLLLKGSELRGVATLTWAEKRPAEFRAAMAELMRWRLEGKLRPEISAVLPLERAAEALAALVERRVTGKIVLAV